MLRSGFGAKGAKSISSMQGGKSTSVDLAGGPDKVIRTLAALILKVGTTRQTLGLLVQPMMQTLTFWYDKGPDQTHLHQ